MSRNKIIPYNPVLRRFSKELRRNSTLAEILLWKEIKARKLGFQFHRQVPIDNLILDFYCHELMIGIEVDGASHESQSQFEKDRLKDYTLSHLGILIIRLNDIDIKKNLNSVIQFLIHRIEEVSP